MKRTIIGVALAVSLLLGIHNADAQNWVQISINDPVIKSAFIDVESIMPAGKDMPESKKVWVKSYSHGYIFMGHYVFSPDRKFYLQDVIIFQENGDIYNACVTRSREWTPIDKLPIGRATYPYLFQK